LNGTRSHFPGRREAVPSGCGNIAERPGEWLAKG